MEIVSRVYVYILSMVKRCLSGENTYLFFATTPPYRWTAISMGASRHQNDSGSISIDIDPPSPNFFTDYASWISVSAIAASNSIINCSLFGRAFFG
jgi:hypothetical protein